MLIELLPVFEYAIALIAAKPVLALLVSQTLIALIARESSVAPAAFDLAPVVDAVVEVVAYAISRELAAATGWHGLWCLFRGVILRCYSLWGTVGTGGRSRW